jgi:hypothetical protein
MEKKITHLIYREHDTRDSSRHTSPELPRITPGESAGPPGRRAGRVGCAGLPAVANTD